MMSACLPSFVARVSHHELVYLVKGYSNEWPVWHYVVIDSLKLAIFKRMLNSQSMDVSEYGHILDSGWGAEPPADATLKILRRSGVPAISSHKPCAVADSRVA